MSVPYARERSLHLLYDGDDRLISGAAQMLDGLPRLPTAEGDYPPWNHSNPAWINLTGFIVGHSSGHSRVDFVWPGDHGQRQNPTARLSRNGQATITQDNRRHAYHVQCGWIQVNASLDHQPRGTRIGLESSTILAAGIEQCDALSAGEESVLEAIAHGDALDIVLDRICRLSDAVIARSRCSILLVDHASGHLRHGAGPNLPAECKAAIDAVRFGPSDRSWETSIVAKHPLAVGNSVPAPAWCEFGQPSLAQGIGACWPFPLVASDTVHGIFVIHHEEPRGPDDGETKTARRLARLAAISIMRRRIDEPLLRNEERYALAMQGADVGIWDWDIERGTVYWSPLFKSMVGMKPEDEPVFGTMSMFKNLLHPDDRERVEEVLWRHLGEREPYDTTCRIRRSDGGFRWIRARAQTAWDADGRPIRLVGCIYDITEQKRAEEALSAAREAAETASRARSQFLANISHELWAPLQTILSARDQENTAVIHRSGQQLLGLVNDILDMAQLEAEQVEFHEEVIALASILDEAIQSVRFSQREPQHKLMLDLPSPLPILSADRRCLKQVLVTVLGNAVKSTPKDGRIAVRVTRSGAGLKIVVENSGPGDVESVDPVVLHPLHHIESVMAQQRQGTALGLFISRVLVERHGGTFQVESGPRSGTAVCISLPAERLPTGTVMQVDGSKAWRHVSRNVI
jgi:PAS domain S-box-containing protein